MTRIGQVNAPRQSAVQVNVRLVGSPAGSLHHQGAIRLGGSGTVILGVPAWLYERLARFMGRRGLKSVAEFVVHALNKGATIDEFDRERAEYSEEELKLICRLLRGVG